MKDQFSEEKPNINQNEPPMYEMNDKNSILKGIIFIILSAFCYSLMSLFVRLSGPLPTFQKAFFRNFIAALVGLAILIKDGDWRLPKGSLPALLGRTIAGTVGILCNFYAIDNMNISDASILNKLAPFFSIVFSILILKEKAGWKDWLLVALAFSGALFVVKPSFAISQSLPAVIGVVGGLGAGLAYTFVRKLGSHGERTAMIVFFFSAFERPFELAEEDRKEERAERRIEQGNAMGSAPIIIGGGAPVSGGMPVNGGVNVDATSAEAAVAAAGTAAPVVQNGGGGGTIIIGGGGTIGGGSSADAELVSQMDDATREYVEKIRTLNEAIKRISEQTESLGRNMEEMDTLARNITGINALYEVQLRSASSQVGNIDLVNEETKKMALQIKELNAMYARMLEAMTCNMNRQQ